MVEVARAGGQGQDVPSVTTDWTRVADRDSCRQQVVVSGGMEDG